MGEIIATIGAGCIGTWFNVDVPDPQLDTLLTVRISNMHQTVTGKFSSYVSGWIVLCKVECAAGASGIKVKVRNNELYFFVFA